MAEDEASLFFQATLSAIWQPKGKAILVKTYSGQAKKSFYGALNLHTGREHSLRCDKQCKVATKRFLRRLLKWYPHKRLGILWDNAPWHKGLGEFLRKVKRIELIPFPPYSPELNPQEGVWKKARQAISHNHCFRQFPHLLNAFTSYLKCTKFPTSFLKKHS